MQQGDAADGRSNTGSRCLVHIATLQIDSYNYIYNRGRATTIIIVARDVHDQRRARGSEGLHIVFVVATNVDNDSAKLVRIVAEPGQHDMAHRRFYHPTRGQKRQLPRQLAVGEVRQNSCIKAKHRDSRLVERGSVGPPCQTRQLWCRPARRFHGSEEGRWMATILGQAGPQPLACRGEAGHEVGDEICNIRRQVRRRCPVQRRHHRERLGQANAAGDVGAA